ncbi:MAG: hypothetical protein QM808_05080 [Steroidobacteraceae bacterium]
MSAILFAERHAKYLRVAMLALGGLLAVACSKKESADLHDLSGTWQIAQPIEALLTAENAVPPLLPEAKSLYEQRMAAKKAGDVSFDPSSRCKPPGEPRSLYELGYPFEIVQKPERIDFLYQWNRLFRVIDIDKTLPDFAGPYYYGKSAGHWQGDTLVVQVIGIKGETLLDASGLPHSEDLKLVERFKKLDDNTLEAVLQFDDPKTFSKPWEARMVFARKPAGTLVEDVCEERIKLPGHYSLQYP